MATTLTSHISGLGRCIVLATGGDYQPVARVLAILWEDGTLPYKSFMWAEFKRCTEEGGRSDLGLTRILEVRHWCWILALGYHRY